MKMPRLLRQVGTAIRVATGRQLTKRKMQKAEKGLTTERPTHYDPPGNWDARITRKKFGKTGDGFELVTEEIERSHFDRPKERLIVRKTRKYDSSGRLVSKHTKRPQRFSGIFYR